MCFSHNKQQEQRGTNKAKRCGGQRGIPWNFGVIPAIFVSIGCGKLLLTFCKVRRGSTVGGPQEATRRATTQQNQEKPRKSGASEGWELRKVGALWVVGPKCCASFSLSGRKFALFVSLGCFLVSFWWCDCSSWAVV